MVDLALGILSTWCLSALLYYWSGFEWLRELVDYRVFDCYWCVALIVSIPVTVLVYTVPLVLLPLAYAGGAMLLSKGGRIIWRTMTDG